MCYCSETLGKPTIVHIPFSVPSADIDECQNSNGGCSHTCVNLIGTYRCQCPSGYALLANGRTCQGEPHATMCCSWRSSLVRCSCSFFLFVCFCFLANEHSLWICSGELLFACVSLSIFHFLAWPGCAQVYWNGCTSSSSLNCELSDVCPIALVWKREAFGSPPESVHLLVVFVPDPVALLRYWRMQSSQWHLSVHLSQHCWKFCLYLPCGVCTGIWLTLLPR